MKKTQKAMLKYKITMIGVIMLLSLNVCMATGPINSSVENTGTEMIDSINAPVLKIWNTITLIVGIVSFAIIIFSGIKYMYSSADDKADMKKSMMNLIIGASLTFGFSIIINIVVKIVTQLRF